MRIIIAGGGEVGFHLAEQLLSESHDIIFIDIDQKKLDFIEDELEIITVKGDATSYKVLKEAKVDEADIFIAATSFEKVNILSAIIGKKMGAQRTIARIDNTEYLTDKETLDLYDLGVDDLISPESLAAREVKYLLWEPAVTDTFNFGGGKLILMGLQIDQTAPIVHKTVLETTHLNPSLNFMIAAIHRDNKTIIPRGDFRFEPGDHIYFIALEEGKHQVLEYTGQKHIIIKSLMVVGGSRTGIHIARRLSKYYDIKLIEKDAEKSNELAKTLPNVLIVNGDGTNIGLLKEEGIADIDAFVAVTGHSETNILSCLMAKNQGVKKTIALVENIGLIKLSQTIGIDTMINKKLAAANYIFRNIRKGNVIALTSFHGVDAEILEFKVKEHARITKKPIKDLNFPKTAIISGVIRNGKGQITLGNFQIQPDDQVIIFVLPQSIKEVEKFFE